MPTLSSQMTFSVLWHLTRQHDLIFRQSFLQQIPGNACATVSRLAQRLQRGICSTQPLASSPGGSSTIWREGEGKKNPNQDACTCCSLLARLGVLLKDWDICRGGGAAGPERALLGAEVPAAPGAVSALSPGAEQRGRDRAPRSVRRQTWLKFKPNGLWHKQHSSARDLQWI